MHVSTIGKDQIRQAIHHAALRKNGDKDSEMKAMVGDSDNAGIYMDIVSGEGKKWLKQASEAQRNSLTVDEVLSMKALVGFAKFGLRLTEEAAVDDNYRGLVGSSKRIPDRLKERIEQHRKVHRAREKAWLEEMENKVKNDPYTQTWFARLQADLNDFVKPVVNPFAIDRGMGKRIDGEVLERVFKHGLLRTDASAKHGGFHFNNRQTGFILQFIPVLGGGPGAHISSHKSIGTKPIARFGTPAQQDFFIPPMVNGDENGEHYIATFSATELCSGTNIIKGLSTEARLSEDGTHLEITGHHVYSTNFYVAGLSHMACNIIDEATGTKLPTVIELPLPFRFSDTEEVMLSKIDKLWEQGIQVPDHPQELSGIRGSCQAYWELDNAKVPLEYAPGVSSILGGTDGIGRAPEQLFGGLNSGRCGFITYPAYAADLAVNETLDNLVAKVRYPGEYSESGVLADLELVQSQITEMVVKTAVIKDVAWLTSQIVDTFPEMNIIAEAGIGKAFASDLAIDVIQTAHSLWGGEGYMRGKMIEQALRDIIVLRTVEGINNVMFQHGAAVSAAPLQAKSKIKVFRDLIPSFETGDLDFKDAFGLQLSSRGLAADFVTLGAKATLKHGIRGAQKAIQKQQLTLYELANREAILFARMATMFMIKELKATASRENGYNKKEIAAREQFLYNTSGKGKEKYPPYIGKMFLEDAKIRVRQREIENEMLLKKYG